MCYKAAWGFEKAVTGVRSLKPLLKIGKAAL
jgi:hypothetical protein